MICITTVSFGQSVDNKIQHLLHPQKGDTNVTSELLSYGTDAIPHLIKVIDVKEKGFMGFQDPRSSFIADGTIHNSLGIRAAYVIELILAMDKESYLQKNSGRLYHYGFIVRDSEKEKLKAMENGDMKIIKALYLKWWDHNKSKTISQLRSNWKKGNRPLLKSAFIWV